MTKAQLLVSRPMGTTVEKTLEHLRRPIFNSIQALSRALFEQRLDEHSLRAL